MTSPKHKCSVCDRSGEWTDNWQWYGSIRDDDDGKLLLKTCSQMCRNLIKNADLAYNALQAGQW